MSGRSQLYSFPSYSTERSRIICLLAHVDHGKTTLSDFLIASNGIISQQLAGKIRYMDSRIDEQERQITMKSSSITLRYVHGSIPHLIHLVDSPGHVDFSTEVSTALRLVDGAILLVDVVEGVCAQTHAVLQQAKEENVKPCLFLNKIDKLFTELQFSPSEVYCRLFQILEEVNAIEASLLNFSPSNDGDGEVNSYFCPSKGNVAFGSALQGWAFRIRDFANMFAKKLSIDIDELVKSMWGEYYFNSKSRTIQGKPTRRGNPPLFVQIIAANIAEVFSAVENDDDDKMQTIVSSLGISIPQRELKCKDKETRVASLLSRWLPLHESVLRMVVEEHPNPRDAQSWRMPPLLPEVFVEKSDNDALEKQHSYIKELKSALLECDSSQSVPMVAYMSKLLEMDALPGAVMHSSINPMPSGTEEKEEEAIPEENEMEKFVGFTRIFSGKIEIGQKIYFLDGKHDHLSSDRSTVHEVLVKDLYLLMGRDFERVKEVPAGNVFGLCGMSTFIPKMATLSSSAMTPILVPIHCHAYPIVHAAVEPKDPASMVTLCKGLELLDRADPGVEIHSLDTGEHIIAAVGEVHLDRCMRDLREKYARIDINVSPPLASFKETLGSSRVKQRSAYASTPNSLFSVVVRAISIPENIMTAMSDFATKLRAHSASNDAKCELKMAFEKAGGIWAKMFNKIWATGPTDSYENLLVNNVDEYSRSKWWVEWSRRIDGENFIPVVDPNDESRSTCGDTKLLLVADSRIISGFQLATATGTLCEEPMTGVCFVVDEMNFQSAGSVEGDPYGPFTGQLISTVKECCREAFNYGARRLKEPVYLCRVIATMNVVGKVYSVLAQRRAKILREDVQDGTSLSVIECHLPVLESFGFAEQLRSKTSGSATPQLSFKGWTLVDEDPFFVPTTEEELEEFGDTATAPNYAMQLLNEIRKRKGLHVDEQLVKDGNKQRTLSKNK